MSARAKVKVRGQGHKQSLSISLLNLYTKYEHFRSYGL